MGILLQFYSLLLGGMKIVFFALQLGDMMILRVVVLVARQTEE